MSRTNRDWMFRITDMIKSIEQIETVVNQTNLDDFRTNFIFANSVIRDLEIIGEAAKALPNDIILNYAHIPWQDICDMRNILIHEYFGVNLDIVWLTATVEIKQLKSVLIEIKNNNTKGVKNDHK